MQACPDRFVYDAMRAGVVLGWLSVIAVLGALALGAHVERAGMVLGLSACAAAAHSAIGVVPWQRWLPDRRGRVVLDFWSAGLLGYVTLLVISAGAHTGFDLLLFLVVPFLALAHRGRRRQLFLGASAGAYVAAMTLAPDRLSVGAIALRAVLLCGVAVLALILERAVRREADARAQAAARADLEHALLAESHHRVKNSLQTVADLLLLSRAGDAGGDGFDRTAERIRAIAAVHQLLADRRGGAVAADELLEGVACAAAPDRAYDVEADELLLAPARAQHLGIVANELIANAARHGGAPIVIRLTVGDDVRLEVSDAGSGTTRVVDGLGLRLVRQVTEHGLRGTFTLRPAADGTHAEVCFPRERIPLARR